MAFTSEVSEVLLSKRIQLDSSLRHLQSDDLSTADAACSAYCLVLDSYLELSALLDPILPTHVPQLCLLFTTHFNTFSSDTSTASPDRLILCARALYTVSKVRGVKTFCTHLPHQVSHLRFLLPALHFAEHHLRETHLWFIRYVLFVWSSVAIRVPFPLTSIIPDDLLPVVISDTRTALLDPSRISEVAAVFLARLLSRRDLNTHRHAVVLSTVKQALCSSASREVRTASLALLAALFKFAHRDDLALEISPVLEILTALHPQNTIEAHRLSKLSHRIALAFLSPRPASWRYSRATPRLFVGHASRHGHEGPVDTINSTPDSDENLSLSDNDAESLETIIHFLLQSLPNRDTVVRYSAAKGLARVTARLPLSLTTDVVDALLDSVAQANESRADAMAHGGCLAIAEFSRRGLLLPRTPQFEQAIHAVREAARFELRRGAASVGAQVRDAACYAVWALARAYDSSCIEPFATLISDAMLPIALLDREVNCRRAAAAALQECVGRFKNDLFPEGISLVTIADYFSLGDRSAAYLVLAPKVANLAGRVYFPVILDMLWKNRLSHWDATIRTLAAKALAKFVELDDDRVISRNVLPVLVSMATQRGDVVYRHGSILGLSNLILEMKSDDLEPFSKDLRHIPVLLEEKNMFVGKTCDELRISCCHLIGSIARKIPKFYLESEEARRDAENCLKLLERMLASGHEELYVEATSVYEAMCHHVISSDNKWHVSVTRRILHGLLQSPSPDLQRGFALVAGVCGESSISDDVVRVLCESATSNNDVEVRWNAAKSLRKIPLTTLCTNAEGVIKSLTRGMQDFVIDERGDIGSWVREASMSSFSEIVRRLYDKQGNCILENRDAVNDCVMEGLRQVLHQCCGRIDRTRVVAGDTATSICVLLGQNGDSGSILAETCSKLRELFKADKDGINFSKSDVVFPVLKQALQVSSVRSAIMVGFVDSGGGNRSQFKAPSEALVEFFKGLSGTERGKELGSSILKPIWDREARLIVPALKVLSLLGRHGILLDVDRDVCIEAVQAIRGSWRGKQRDVKLVLSSLSALDELLSVSVGGDGKFDIGPGSVGKEGLEAMSVILGGSIPRLRRGAAESVYVGLNFCDVDGFDGGCDKGVIDAMDLLLDTEWEVINVREAREIRNEVCKLLRINAPVAAKKD